MKKLFVTILTLVAAGSLGANFVFASDQHVSPEETCETMAIEQNIAPEDLEQYINDCLAVLTDEEQEAGQENEADESAKE